MASLVVPHTQEIGLAWPPMPETVSRLTKGGPLETKDSKKRRRQGEDDPTPVKREIPDEIQSHAGEDRRERKVSDASHSDGHAGAASDDSQSLPDDHKWPALARKRQRMSEDERKARHREVQRQFMQRKLAKLDEMRKLVVVLEKQFMLLQVSQERARLEHENDYLHRRVLVTPSHWRHEHPQEAQRRLNSMHMPPALPPARYGSSHPHHSAQLHHRPQAGMLPWDEILEAVSEANV